MTKAKKTAAPTPVEQPAGLPPWPADRIERWPLADLTAYARNARRHSDEQVEKIANSIREFGFTMPVLVAEDGTIIAGHGRVLAAHKIGLAEVPVIIARGWTDEQRRAYTIADNQLTLDGEWDEAVLRAELASLRDDGADLALTGFDPAEIDKMLEVPEAPDEFAEFDEGIQTDHKCPRCGYQWSGKEA